MSSPIRVPGLPACAWTTGVQGSSRHTAAIVATTSSWRIWEAMAYPPVGSGSDARATFVAVLRCHAHDRDFRPGPGVAQVGRVARVVSHDDNLFDVAADDRSRLGDLAGDNHAHELGDAWWRRAGVAGVRRPGSAAVRRRKPEEVVFESGEALHCIGWSSPAHEIDRRPLTAPPRDVVAEPGFQIADDESRALSGGEGEDGHGASGGGGGAAADVLDRRGDQEGPGRTVGVSSTDGIQRIARTTGDRAGR